MFRRWEPSRRILGAFFVSAAVVMVVAGLSVFRNLDGVPFLIYWLVCYLFTVLAIGMAILEIVAIQKKARQERTELVRRTIAEVGKPPDESDKREPASDREAQ